MVGEMSDEQDAIQGQKWLEIDEYCMGKSYKLTSWKY